MSDWRVVGQHRHVVLSHQLDDEGELFVRTGCGALIWPSTIDTRLGDAPVCCPCSVLYPPQ